MGACAPSGDARQSSAKRCVTVQHPKRGELFFASARSNRVGPTPDLLDELKLRSIKVKIWLP